MKHIKEDPSAPGSPVRPEDNQNIDQLIPKLNFFFYGDSSNIDNIDKQGGIYTPEAMVKKFPNQADQIKDIYKHIWDCDIKRNSVIGFFSRVPIDLPNTKGYIQNNTPVRISVTKLLKAKHPYRAYIFNLRNNPKKVHEIKTPHIDKLSKQEDRWYQDFKNSNDPYFRDVPQVAIYCGDAGMVPSFACRILRGE
jgi:hypothetical protein